MYSAKCYFASGYYNIEFPKLMCSIKLEFNYSSISIYKEYYYSII